MSRKVTVSTGPGAYDEQRFKAVRPRANTAVIGNTPRFKLPQKAQFLGKGYDNDQKAQESPGPAQFNLGNKQHVCKKQSAAHSFGKSAASRRAVKGAAKSNALSMRDVEATNERSSWISGTTRGSGQNAQVEFCKKRSLNEPASMSQAERSAIDRAVLPRVDGGLSTDKMSRFGFRHELEQTMSRFGDGAGGGGGAAGGGGGGGAGGSGGKDKGGETTRAQYISADHALKENYGVFSPGPQVTAHAAGGAETHVLAAGTRRGTRLAPARPSLLAAGAGPTPHNTALTLQPTHFLRRLVRLALSASPRAALDAHHTNSAAPCCRAPPRALPTRCTQEAAAQCSRRCAAGRSRGHTRPSCCRCGWRAWPRTRPASTAART
jgi:hypothetical protein